MCVIHNIHLLHVREIQIGLQIDVIEKTRHEPQVAT